MGAGVVQKAASAYQIRQCIWNLTYFEAGFAIRFRGAETPDFGKRTPRTAASSILRPSTRDVPACGLSRQFRAGDSIGEVRPINCIVQMQLAVERPVLQEDGSLRAKAGLLQGDVVICDFR